jgi:hypothetical protein
LIEELTEAALEAIEQAAGEAAKAATLASLEREEAALREAQRLKQEMEMLKQAQPKNYVLTGVICFLGGLAVGVTGTILMRNAKK